MNVRTARRERPGLRTTPHALLLLAIAATLTLLGLAMVLSASAPAAFKTNHSAYHYLNRQLIAALIGGVGMVITIRTPYQRYRTYAPQLLAVSVAMLVLVIIPKNPLAISVKGASRWLGFGAVQFQPSEFAKFALIIYAASLLAERMSRLDDPSVTVRPIMLVFAGFATLVMGQPDLGTTVLLFVIVVTMLVFAGGNLGSLARYSAVAVAGGLVVSAATPFRRARLLAFLDPWSAPTGSGYQILQSGVGFAEGGLFGTGIGTARAKYGFLPEAHTDFLYAILGEELGLVGAVLVLAIFLLFAAVGLRVAVLTNDMFGRMVATGITTWIVAQALLNMGVATGAFPNKGITLPLMSYGGSSLVVTMCAVGVLINVARQIPTAATTHGAGSAPGISGESPTRSRLAARSRSLRSALVGAGSTASNAEPNTRSVRATTNAAAPTARGASRSRQTPSRAVSSRSVPGPKTTRTRRSTRG